MSGARLDPSWLVGITTFGFVAAGPSSDARIDFESDFETRQALLRLLDDRPAEADADAAQWLALLADLGALAAHDDGQPAPLPDGVARLGDAIPAVAGDGPVPRLAVTADEALVLPDGLDRAAARAAIQAFVRGISPHARRAAYCYSANWELPTTVGDLPEQDAVADALERARALDPERLHVIDLGAGTVASAHPDELGALSAARAHRLGPVVAVVALDDLRDAPGAPQVYGARWAAPNLRFPGEPDSDWARGYAYDDAELAELIARAEAAERFASGDVSRAPLVRARYADLAGAVAPQELFALSERQLSAATDWHRPFDPAEELLWAPATAPDGSRRWILADCIHYPFSDPERRGKLVDASSSGVAAHSTFAEARDRAFRELIERDAFMWHWIQRQARETIDPETLPAGVRAHTAGLRSIGLETTFVNLTLDSQPVILCALHASDTLRLGAACNADPAAAVAKALDEADGIRLIAERDDTPPPADPSEVRTPQQHLALHQGGDRRGDHEFLLGSGETVALAEIARGVDDVVGDLGDVGEPLVVDMTSAASRPFHVVRAFVPGLVPISFGYDREPLGMGRLASPLRIRDGRVLGNALDLAESVPILPHPFP